MLSSPPIKTVQQVVLQGLSWDTYQALVRDLDAAPGQRLTYDQGMLEIMVPLPPHEDYKRKVGRMVETTTEELGLEIRSLGSTTWKREDLRKGLEPDECYYIQHEQAVRGQLTIDLMAAPPPDLAIEIDNTSSSMSRMDIYAALGFPEVWRFDGDRLSILCLQSGQYIEQARSQALPILSQADILHFLQLSQTMGETSWVRSLRQWLRERTEDLQQ